MNLEQEDVLITRVLDGEASSADWSGLESLAQADPAVWKRLAETLRAQAALTRGAGEILETAGGVEAPAPGPGARPGLRPWWTWSGWAAALILGFFWALGPHHSPAPLPEKAFLQASQPASHAVPGKATLVGEFPRVMVDSQRTPRGDRYEVTYLRRLLEKVVVDDLYQINPDEWGEPRAVPVVGLPRTPQESF